MFLDCWVLCLHWDLRDFKFRFLCVDCFGCKFCETLICSIQLVCIGVGFGALILELIRAFGRIGEFFAVLLVLSCDRMYIARFEGIFVFGFRLGFGWF